jgi:hypothetical protein
MHNKVKELLLGDKPCSIGKIGSIEFLHFAPWFINNEMSYFGNSLAINAGINVSSDEEYFQWYKDFGNSIQNLDAILAWNGPLEKKVLKDFNYKGIILDNFPDIEPFSHEKEGWHYELKDKKVLIISSFGESIKQQIPNFNKIWEGAELGCCEVITSRNPYQITGEKKFFYNDEMWRLTNEISKRHFDICIIGAGGYSLPLCNFVKSIGKKAIHLGGATQVLFGIRGSRFDRNFKDMPWYGTDTFIRPLESDIPKYHYLVEDSCYW